MRSPAQAIASVPPCPAIARVLWQWSLLGLLALALLPTPFHPWFGSAWVWGVMAPLVSLLTLYRHAMLAAWVAVLVHRPRRRRSRRAGGQARRTAVAGPGLRMPQRAA